MTPEKITLTDPSGSSADVLVGFGFNCFRFTAMRAEPVEVIWAADDFATGNERPSGSGIPILFPFPGRLRGTTFVWEGREYSLPEGDGRGNAIHGFLHSRPWRLLDRSETTVTAQFQASVDDPSLLDCWPADFVVTGTYELAGAELRSRFRIENPDSRTLPCGFGTHPYFCVPLGGSVENCFVKLPVRAQWQLIDMLPTGRKLAIENAEQFAAGLPFPEMEFDNVFTDLAADAGRCQSTLEDRDSGVRVSITFDDWFRQCVVYNPGHRQAVCIEPYSYIPGAYDPADRGQSAGWHLLEPGESLEASIDIRCE